MIAFIGLGNVGFRYKETKHNAGFWVIDEFARRKKLSFSPAKTEYVFTKHKTKPQKKNLQTIYLCKNSKKDIINELQNVIDAVYFTRDLINTPFSHLTAKDLANAAINSGKKMELTLPY